MSRPVETQKLRTPEQELKYLRHRCRHLHKRNILLEAELESWHFARDIAAAGPRRQLKKLKEEREGMEKALRELRIDLENQTKWADRWRGAVQALAWQQGLDIDDLENKL
jgi:uncharacterized membrane protein